MYSFLFGFFLHRYALDLSAHDSLVVFRWRKISFNRNSLCKMRSANWLHIEEIHPSRFKGVRENIDLAEILKKHYPFIWFKGDILRNKNMDPESVIYAKLLLYYLVINAVKLFVTKGTAITVLARISSYHRHFVVSSVQRNRSLHQILYFFNLWIKNTRRVLEISQKKCNCNFQGKINEQKAKIRQKLCFCTRVGVGVPLLLTR